MIRRAGPLLIVALMFALALTGCSDDSVVPTDNEQSNTSGLIKGDIDASGDGFEYTTETAGDPQSPIPGPFVIRGKNIHYVDSLSVLSVDFTVEQRCRCDLPEPIGLTFINLFPGGVTVENPDNGENGPGAAIVFEFENDDGVWSPFEESLPRTVHFGVDPGASIGFVARIDIGMDLDLGSIGGVVWYDFDEDGILDGDEPGIGGVEIHMYRIDGPERSRRPEILWRTLTSPNGSYRFDLLAAGHYEVRTVPRDDLRPTTPAMIQVILVENDGMVSDFLMANFGAIPVGMPRPTIERGDFVDVYGKHEKTADHRVMARLIQVYKCDDKRPPAPVLSSGTTGDHAADVDVCHLRIGALMGPVTAIDRDERVLWVMGTPVHIDTAMTDTTIAPPPAGNVEQPPREPIDFDDVNVGDRVAVFAWNNPEHRTLDGIAIYKAWSEADEVHGRVDSTLMTANSERMIDAFVAMRTTIVITQSTEIKFVY